ISTIGEVMGTLAYMSPEQVRGENLTSATDIFSLGITIYELCTGRRPFQGDSPVLVMAAILEDTPIAASRLNPEVSPTLDALLSRMLDKRAELRPTGKEVETILTAVATERSESTSPSTTALRWVHVSSLMFALWSAPAGRAGGRFHVLRGQTPMPTLPRYSGRPVTLLVIRNDCRRVLQ